jgi:carbon-monoxide dehydrogenase medium subunit
VQAFDYVLAQSLEHAIALLSQDGDSARVLGGGTDLLVQLREGRRQARLLVDVKGIPELNDLGYDPASGLRMGAAVPCHILCRYPALAEAYPGLIAAISLIGGTQIQGRASVGGNLCNASPAADAIPALIVHRAVCAIWGPGGPREVPAEEFCVAPNRTVLQPGELLVAVHVPPPGPGFGAHYLRFIPRNEMDIAVVGAGAAVVLDARGESFVAARIALAAVAPVPLFVPAAGESLVGRQVSDQAIREAARIAQAATRPIDDMRGTIAQRRHLAEVLTRRALWKAVERARAAGG